MIQEIRFECLTIQCERHKCKCLLVCGTVSGGQHDGLLKRRSSSADSDGDEDNCHGTTGQLSRSFHPGQSKPPPGHGTTKLLLEKGGKSCEPAVGATNKGQQDTITLLRTLLCMY